VLRARRILVGRVSFLIALCYLLFLLLMHFRPFPVFLLGLPGSRVAFFFHLGKFLMKQPPFFFRRTHSVYALSGALRQLLLHEPLIPCLSILWSRPPQAPFSYVIPLRGRAAIAALCRPSLAQRLTATPPGCPAERQTIPPVKFFSMAAFPPFPPPPPLLG